MDTSPFYSSLPSHFFKKNRHKIWHDLSEESIAILHSNAPLYTNGDGVLRYIQNSHLYYLSGIKQEATILVIIKSDRISFKEILFIKSRNPQEEIWNGEMLSPVQASAISGIEEVRSLAEFEDFIVRQILSIKNIYLPLNENPRASFFETPEHQFTKWVQKRFPLHSRRRLSPMIHKHRMIKSQEEIELIRKAISITEVGIRRLLKEIKAGQYEYELEAVLSYEFIRNGSRGVSGFAYPPIVASGKNSCVLHYLSNHRKLQPHEIVLLDVGAMYDYYCADITRVLPVSGAYPPRTKEVYRAVQTVLSQAIEWIKPGLSFANYRCRTNELIEEQLGRLGLLDTKNQENKTKQSQANRSFKDFFMHGISHQLGLDVHDPEGDSPSFQPGMVITCEPGIYIDSEAIGVRLEENVLVTEEGAENLSRNIPIDPDEITSLMT